MPSSPFYLQVGAHSKINDAIRALKKVIKCVLHTCLIIYIFHGYIYALRMHCAWLLYMILHVNNAKIEVGLDSKKSAEERINFIALVSVWHPQIADQSPIMAAP